MVIKMLTEVRRTMHEQSEKLNKETESIVKPWFSSNMVCECSAR